ncbi:prepilin-type N-terminal cleavage/methylation domain-containing protein [Campylobacter sp.]|uniref:prepilin-type N-terminal cleavage/methylation domain-containing protein n=1 Tax=Campylobacter sp. TaxID=205 RepID=UPI002A67C8DA|nr:prepilin-type N-terminal cleavage/methylation domain-containing protein [Campylobacter sp.]MDD7703718.1 prepilin-type N-terminal cleavage/methylation domain-containing protein [Campylobacteraceae bacterium]MDY2635510.1 prepilin-type N-terminal cleavage/methylation domain-containing protein [Campylobacter sp.]
MKGAFSLIELLLAIVVVGVAVAALPFIAISTGKANVQAVVSEVVTSSRIFIDDILSEPWNSAIADGFTDSSGAVMYSGILDAQSGDARFVDSTKKHFSRTLAKDKDGNAIQAAGITSCNSGINCKDKAVAKISKGSKNAFDFDITAGVKFINIAETRDGTKITATFSDTATTTDTTNAMLVSATATGKNGGDIIEGVKQIKLNGFAFNIGTEPR